MVNFLGFVFFVIIFFLIFVYKCKVFLHSLSFSDNVKKAKKDTHNNIILKKANRLELYFDQYKNIKKEDFGFTTVYEDKKNRNKFFFIKKIFGISDLKNVADQIVYDKLENKK